MKAFLVLALVGLVALAAACGGNGIGSGNEAVIERVAARDAAEKNLIAHLEDAGVTFEDGYGRLGECGVPVVMTSPQAVELYRGAGDNVLTDRSGEFGIKVSGGDASCATTLAQAMDTWPGI